METSTCKNCGRAIVKKQSGPMTRWTHEVHDVCKRPMPYDAEDPVIEPDPIGDLEKTRQSMIDKRIGGPAPLLAEEPAAPEPKKRRGRPKGAKNKPDAPSDAAVRAAGVVEGKKRHRRRLAHIELLDGTLVATIAFPIDFAGGEVSFILNEKGLRTLKTAIEELP